MSGNYALALCNDPDATLDDVREAVTTLEDIVERGVGVVAECQRIIPAHP